MSFPCISLLFWPVNHSFLLQLQLVVAGTHVLTVEREADIIVSWP